MIPSNGNAIPWCNNCQSEEALIRAVRKTKKGKRETFNFCIECAVKKLIE